MDDKNNMPAITGPPKEKVTIGITPKNMRNIAIEMSNNQYSTITDLVNEALTAFFDRTSRKENVKEWLVSEEGTEYLKKVIHEVQEKR